MVVGSAISAAMQALEAFFQALSDRTRLRLINLLAGGEVCVCYFVAVLGETQPKISRHLGYLRRRGLVRTRREGKWIHYSLAAPADRRVAKVLGDVVAALEADREMQRDRDLLRKACCALRPPAPLRNAPKPVVR
jgi:ArsR family transcriptional regulator, arsenate/arsenite/antimonite-responsive transcriptional repressor